MKKLTVNMLSIANTVKGQGVETAYNELTNLLDKYGKDDIKYVVNKGLGYDVMHMHTVNPASYFKQRFSKGVSLTYVHFLPNSLVGSLKLPKFYMNVYAWWTKRCYLKSDYLVVVNPLYIDEIAKMGYPKERIFFIPNFVSSSKFYVMSNEEKNRNRKRYGFKKSDFIVISVGQLHKGKGIFEFIDIAEKNPDIEFLWVGGFTFGKWMEGYDDIKRIYDNPPRNLHFVGVVDREEVNVLCNISDVFFFPSFYESFGLVALEVAFTLKPLVLRDLDVYKTVYKNNYLSGNTNEEFIKIIRDLKDNKKLYDEYVKKSNNIRNMYDEYGIYKKWLDLYKTISKKEYQK